MHLGNLRPKPESRRIGLRPLTGLCFWKLYQRFLSRKDFEREWRSLHF
jgi:hypothetical protein